MRVIFINVSEWDAMKPRPRKPPQVLRLPKLFQEVRQPIAPQHDVFLSYNSQDIEYVSELYQMLVRCGLRVWFDENEFGGGTGLASELIKASNLSRIFSSGPREERVRPVAASGRVESPTPEVHSGSEAGRAPPPARRRAGRLCLEDLPQ